MSPVIAGVYVRKSNEDTGNADVKSVTVQRAVIEAFAAKRGWTIDERYVFADDGISGAEFKKRPGLRALLHLLEADQPPIRVLVVTELSRIGRDTVRTLAAIQEIEEAGVEIWSATEDKRIESDDVTTMVGSWSASKERKATITRVRNASFARHENGYVPGGKVFGYRNERLPGAGKQPVRRVIDEAQAAVVRRIFTLTAAGHGLRRVSVQLNAEGIAGPRDTWAPSGVREILTRELYRGVVIHGRVTRERRRGQKVRIRVPESEWKRREAPELRIVSDEQWDAAHAQTAATSVKYLRQGNKIVGKAESFNGKYLLSAGLAVCGATAPDGTICYATLRVEGRGHNRVLAYVCQAHRERGDSVCTNGTGIPAELLHNAVIRSLRSTFNAETFEAHLKHSAEDESARASRAAERASIIARLPVLATQEERLADAVATGDGSVSALVAALKARQQERQDLESRLAELETWERDAEADRDRVEQLRERWGSWQGALDQDPVLARQLIKKVLGTPIYVRPTGKGEWFYVGIGRYDRLLSGVVAPGEVAVIRREGQNREEILTSFLQGLDIDTTSATNPPISGGSDAPSDGCSTLGVSVEAPM
jgi:DNA invertase Pin-like site-specific DNA recombinase